MTWSINSVTMTVTYQGAAATNSTNDVLTSLDGFGRTYLTQNREATEADAERQLLGLDENTFAIYKTVAVASPGSNGANAKTLNALFESLPDFRWNKQQESKLRTELYKALRPLVGTEKMIDLANKLLRLQRV